MKHANLTALLQLIDRKKFNNLAEKAKIDKGVRSFSTWEMTCALLTSIALNLGSFREIESVLGVAKSTLSDALSKRCNGFFGDLCSAVVQQLRDGSRSCKIRRGAREILAMDASECTVHGSLFRVPRWVRAKLQGNKASCKLHVIYNVGREWIDGFEISGNKRGDAKIARRFEFSKNKIYVFDRAYNDHGLWLRIRSAGSHFVSRLKESPKSRVLLKEVLEKAGAMSGVLLDGFYEPSQCLYYRYDLKRLPVRLVIYRDPESNRVFQFITSDLKLAAVTIAGIYKKRWAVELLFRWLKGHLNIRYLPVKSTNAVKTQLSCAILLRLVIELSRQKSKCKATAWELLRLIRTFYLRATLSRTGAPVGCRWSAAMAIVSTA